MVKPARFAFFAQVGGALTASVFGATETCFKAIRSFGNKHATSRIAECALPSTINVVGDRILEAFGAYVVRTQNTMRLAALQTVFIRTLNRDEVAI